MVILSSIFVHNSTLHTVKLQSSIVASLAQNQQNHKVRTQIQVEAANLAFIISSLTPSLKSFLSLALSKLVGPAG